MFSSWADVAGALPAFPNMLDKAVMDSTAVRIPPRRQEAIYIYMPPGVLTCEHGVLT